MAILHPISLIYEIAIPQSWSIEPHDSPTIHFVLLYAEKSEINQSLIHGSSHGGRK